MGVGALLLLGGPLVGTWGTLRHLQGRCLLEEVSRVLCLV